MAVKSDLMYYIVNSVEVKVKLTVTKRFTSTGLSPVLSSPLFSSSTLRSATLKSLIFFPTMSDIATLN